SGEDHGFSQTLAGVGLYSVNKSAQPAHLGHAHLSCDRKMIMSSSGKVEMSSWLVDSRPSKGGQDERRGHDEAPCSGSQAAASAPPGAGETAHSSRSGGALGADGSAGPAAGAAGATGGRSCGGAPAAGPAVEPASGGRAQGQGLARVCPALW